MLISAIAAIAENRVIGKEEGIPWYLPDDLKWFKKNTLGKHLIMGRNTYESLGKPLPKRTNIIVTRDLFYVSSGALVVHSVEEGLELALNNGEEEVFIAGGGQIYQHSMPLWDRFYLTEVHASIEGDTLFPEWDKSLWIESFCEYHEADDRHDFPFTFKILERKK